MNNNWVSQKSNIVLKRIENNIDTNDIVFRPKQIYYFQILTDVVIAKYGS